MSKFSNNLTPSLLLEAQTGTPALTNATGAMVAGQFRLFIEGGVMKLVDYQGNVTSQFPAGSTGTIYYQAADGSIATLPIGTNGQFLSIAAGLPAWVAAPSGGGGSTTKAFTFGSNGDANGLFYYLGTLAGVGGSWINPSNTAKLGTTASGAQFQGNTSNLYCVTDRAVETGTGHYDCVVIGDNTNHCWIQFDLGSNNTFQPTYLNFENRGPYNSDGTTVYVPCSEVTLSGSNDGSTFTNLGVVTITNQAPSNWTGAAMTGSGSYRYLRVTATGSDGTGALGVGELEMYGTLTTAAAASADALLTGTPLGSTPYSDMYALANAFDGDTSSQYAGAGTSGQYIGMDFGASKTVTSCSIWPRPGSSSMPGAQIQTSTDGSTWVNSGQVCPSSIPDGTYTTFTFTSPVVTRYLRILGLEGSRADCCEIQFIGH